LLASPLTAQAQRLTNRDAETRFVDSILARMTVAEKLRQLNQVSGTGNPTGPGGGERAARMDRLRRGGIGSFLNIVGADTTHALQKIAVEQSRMHIPVVFALDVIHGMRTIFPVPLAEAASWDPGMSQRAAHVAAAEASALGIDWTFAPMVDIARDPRWGRIVEGSGEDPYLGWAFADARVRGFQGTNLASHDAIAATAKHFAAYGAAEGGRDYNVAEVSERTLRDVYLPPFHGAVCAGAATLMASFNEIAGVPSHANHHLVTDILRNEWKFDGLVVSDWTGIWELMNHGVAADSAQAGELALHAGVDVDMVSEIYARVLPRSVRAKRVDMAELDEAVRRMLRLKYRLGLFSNPYVREDAARERTDILTAANRAAARESGRRSIVLLKNDRQTLPLRRDLASLAVIGALASDSGVVLGNWGAIGRREDAVSVLDGIRRAVSAQTSVTYARGASPTSDDTTGIVEAVRVARAADAVVLVVGETGEMSAEAESRSTLALPGAQQQLADAMAATGKPVIVVLLNGRPLSIERLHQTMPAILETWFLGIEHGNAVADVLFGEANPGGKLPVTVPRSVGQVPIYYNHKNTGRPPVAAEKYTSKYWDIPYTPLYPFGFGLSYTTFDVSAPRLSATTIAPNDSLRVEFDVTNTGQRSGDEVVQLYIRDDVGSVTRPVMELRRFRRVTLAPGQRTTIRWSLGMADLAFYDLAMRRVAEPGTFRLFVGTSSADTQSQPFRLSGTRSVPVAESCQ
ncbi:MAG TPA: glycoside hydrolase family 3 N-terminal domain-containing protein, partial [Gemmatimonadaceae bacterium]|nr:glycoside hydrolase family 3 N-terminal domain-containing protein [Gemmatimonadaceae bacterium]